MIITEETKSRVKLRLPPAFTFKLHREFRDFYSKRSPGIAYEIDFQEVTSFDSSAMGMLLLLRSYCGEMTADIRLINCNPRIMQILKTATFDSYFSIEGS